MTTTMPDIYRKEISKFAVKRLVPSACNPVPYHVLQQTKLRSVTTLQQQLADICQLQISKQNIYTAH